LPGDPPRTEAAGPQAGADGTETDADGGASAMLDDLLSDVRDGDVHNEDGGDGGGGGGGPESVHRPATARPDGKAPANDASGGCSQGACAEVQDGGALLDRCGLCVEKTTGEPAEQVGTPPSSGQKRPQGLPESTFTESVQ
ncbi:hypothetical protein THAOC_28969, partial [Thalassiosira oceanica]